MLSYFIKIVKITKPLFEAYKTYIFRMGFPEMFQPSEKWESTSARSILMAAKVNDAFFDDTVYKVSPASTLKKKTYETKDEKMTEL